MSLVDLIIIPVLLGFIGFFEPCSIGINLIFLHRIRDYPKLKRVWETTLFTFVRGFFLALVGLSAAFIGKNFIMIQSKAFIFLGIVYILLGVISIIQMYHPIFKGDINLFKYFKNRGTIALGIIFGFIIPACAIAFVVVLITSAVAQGNLVSGFVSLFLFGITLSFPLILISYSEKSVLIIQKISAKVKNIPWLAGVILIVIGVLTLLSSIWWAGAL